MAEPARPSIAGRFPVKFAVVSESTVADNEIVAAVSDKRIRVVSCVIIAAGNVVVTWKTGGTAISGAMTLIQGGGYAIADPESGLFETTVGANLELALSAGVQVSGHIGYVELD